MRKKVFYVTMAAIFAATSCTNELPNKQSSDVINIVASISSQTRAPQLSNDGSGSFSQGDKMSLFLAEDDANIQSVDYEYGSGVLTWGSLGFEDSNVQITLAACYPQQERIQNGEFEFNTLTASDKDLLLASAQSVTVGTSEAVYLTFNHALHRLDLTFTPGNSYTDEDLKSLSIALSAKTTCVVDAVQGKIKEVKNETGTSTVNGSKASFYLIPQNTSGVTLNISVGNDKKSLTLDKLLEQLGSDQPDLNGGKRCTLTLKVNREGITVEGGSINSWDDQVTADGEIVIG